MPEDKTFANVLKALTEAVCQYIRQEIARALKVALEDVPQRARRVVLRLGLGLLLVLAGVVGLLVGVILLLERWLSPWAVYLIIGGLGLLTGALLLRGVGGKSGREGEGDE